MSKSIVKTMFIAVVLGVFSFGSSQLYAGQFDVDAKLKQCQAAFAKSRDKNITRGQAKKARLAHVKLTLEILRHLNNENAAAAKKNKTLSAEQTTKNIRVMGHLLEMIAGSHMPDDADWSYVY
ncbi:MAG TPA: hypothetical protein ENI80_05705 [Acidiferrobacteraceae bacterium]|nr:hypothetical protein [Acidiferrobacteraceae bacterium]